MKFNSSKCKIIHLGDISDRAEYTMKDSSVEVSVEVVTEEKDLGIWIADKLKFSTHVGHAIIIIIIHSFLYRHKVVTSEAKGNQVLGLIKR